MLCSGRAFCLESGMMTMTAAREERDRNSIGRTLPPGKWRHEQRLILDTILLGIVGALSAQLFLFLLHWGQAFFLNRLAGYAPPGVPNEGGVLQQVIGAHGLWLIPVATTLGGLISGFLIYSFAPEAEGHGTDTAVKAFHRTGGFIRTRVPFLKMAASAITIGSGGAGGREGPTALISAGIGSAYASATHRPDEERRLLMLIGMAAGLSAIFRSPIGTAIFAIEVLYGGMEFESGALFYTMVGSVVAYAVNGLFVGWQPLFLFPESLAPPNFFDYFSYAGLGIAAGVIATLVPVVFYGARDGFHALALPPHVKPAIGGLCIGLLALVLPQVLGGGYGWIQEAMDGRLTASLMLVLIFARLAAFAFTISSGGSGGVFAPTLYVGAMLGGFLAQTFHQPSAAFVVVSMAAVFGAAARVPIATLLMVTEMTGGYHLLVPAALAVMLSYFIQTVLSAHLKYQSLYEAQVPARADSPAHHVEHVETALRLLRERRFSTPPTTTHLDLRNLLTHGIAVDLPDRKRMFLARIAPESPGAGRSAAHFLEPTNDDDAELVAVLRDQHLLLPHDDVRLRRGDQLLLIASGPEWNTLKEQLALANVEDVEDQQVRS
jgi:CIC family chloride channel protein